MKFSLRGLVAAGFAATVISLAVIYALPFLFFLPGLQLMQLMGSLFLEPGTDATALGEFFYLFARPGIRHGVCGALEPRNRLSHMAHGSSLRAGSRSPGYRGSSDSLCSPPAQLASLPDRRQVDCPASVHPRLRFSDGSALSGFRRSMASL